MSNSMPADYAPRHQAERRKPAHLVNAHAILASTLRQSPPLQVLLSLLPLLFIHSKMSEDSCLTQVAKPSERSIVKYSCRTPPFSYRPLSKAVGIPYHAASIVVEPQSVMCKSQLANNCGK